MAEPAVAPPTAPGTEEASKSGRLAALAGSWDLALRFGLLGIVILLTIYFEIRRSDVFLTVDNIQNIARQMSFYGVIAIGETFVIITAGIDLSVGSIVGLSGVLAALELLHGWPLALALITPLLLSLAIGIFNGLLIDTQKLPPFIVTLGMLTILRGITQIAGAGQQVTFYPAGQSYTNFGTNSFLGVPDLFIVLIVVAIVGGIYLHLTRHGRYIYAMGSNAEGARRAGVNVRATTLLVYGVSAFLAGVAGLMLTARVGQGDPNGGTGFELIAIAAAVLGGASLFGARGSVIGTFLGVLLLSEIENGLDLINVDPFWARVVEGTLLIIIVWIDQWRKRRLQNVGA